MTTTPTTSTWVRQPQRGYSWPPFEPGNTAAMKHGAASPRKVRPLAEAIAADLADAAPWAARPTFAATVAAWSWAEAQAVLLRRYLDEFGPLDDERNPRPAIALLDRVERRAANLRTELGLSPMAMARLMNMLSAAPAGTDDEGLERLKAEGRALVEARTAAIENGGGERREDGRG